MRSFAIIVSILASMAIASPQGLIKRGGGGGGGGSSKTVTVTTTDTVTTSTAPTTTGSGSGGAGAYDPCSSGLYGLAYCCEANVLQVLGVTCAEVSPSPDSAADYVTACGADVPACCVLGAAGLGVLCTTPEGV